MNTKTLYRAAGAVFLTLMLGAPAPAAEGPQIPIQDFARRPKLNQVQFSPDGKLFAALQEHKERMNLVVGDLKARKLTRVTSFTTLDVSSYQWISNTRLTFSLWDAKKGLGEQRGGGLFAINWDGSESKEISPSSLTCESKNERCRQTGFLQRIYGSEDEIIAESNDRDAKTSDVYRLNTRTGKKTLLTEDNPGRVGKWILDKDNVPRAAVSMDGKKQLETFWYRDSAASPWRKMSSTQGIGKPHTIPAAIDADGTLFVFSDMDSDKSQIRVMDPATGKLGEVVAADPQHDLGDVAFYPTLPLVTLKNHRVVGFFSQADKPNILWMDEKYAKLQLLIDANLAKGAVNRFSILDDDRVVVTSYSDRDPGSFFLYDPKTKEIQELLHPYDWLKPEQLSAMQSIRYKARDGLEIQAYLTLPQGKVAKNLPLVAYIHGGPWARDIWAYEPDVQFLASRGYAVFQPNYRGSVGFGLHHYTASFKQWGLTMQDDITDGIRDLANKGIVDINRVCIAGGSYGGYATLQGLVKEPDLFKCGVAEAAVADLIWHEDIAYSDFNEADPESSESFFSVTMGDSKTDRALLEQNSPRLHADRIKAPLLIVHGALDQRVPIKHAEGMRDAMKAAGKSYEWLVYSEEAHGFVKEENRVDRYQKIEAFLKKNIGQ